MHVLGSRLRCTRLDLEKYYVIEPPSQDGTNSRTSFLEKNLFIQGGKKTTIQDTWIILDTSSTASVTNNEFFVTGVRQCLSDYVLTMMTNGGSQVFDKGVILNLFPLHVHVNIYSMETNLSLKDVTDILGVNVTMDTAIQKAIIVQLDRGKIYKPKKCDEGLY